MFGHTIFIISTDANIHISSKKTKKNPNIKVYLLLNFYKNKKIVIHLAYTKLHCAILFFFNFLRNTETTICIYIHPLNVNIPIITEI